MNKTNITKGMIVIGDYFKARTQAGQPLPLVISEFVSQHAKKLVGMPPVGQCNREQLERYLQAAQECIDLVNVLDYMYQDAPYTEFLKIYRQARECAISTRSEIMERITYLDRQKTKWN